MLVLAVDIDCCAFRRGAVGDNAVAQLVTRHVDTFLRVYGDIIDQHAATRRSGMAMDDIMGVGVSEGESVHYGMLHVHHGDHVGGVVLIAPCAADTGDVRCDGCHIVAGIAGAGVGVGQRNRVAAVQTHMALYTYRRSTDVLIQVVTRSGGVDRTFLHEDLDVVIPLFLARRKPSFQRREHIMVGASRIIHQVLAEELDRLADIADRVVPGIAFFILIDKFPFCVEHALTARIDEDRRDSGTAGSALLSLRGYQRIGDRIGPAHQSTQSRNRSEGVGYYTIVGMGMENPLGDSLDSVRHLDTLLVQRRIGGQVPDTGSRDGT